MPPVVGMATSKPDHPPKEQRTADPLELERCMRQEEVWQPEQAMRGIEREEVGVEECGE